MPKLQANGHVFAPIAGDEDSWLQCSCGAMISPEIKYWEIPARETCGCRLCLPCRLTHGQLDSDWPPAWVQEAWL
jgi:hypothetical protein